MNIIDVQRGIQLEENTRYQIVEPTQWVINIVRLIKTIAIVD